MFIVHGNLDDDSYGVDYDNSSDLVYYSNSNPDIEFITLDQGVYGAWIDYDPYTYPYPNGEGFYSTADSAWYLWAKNLLGL